MWPGRRLVNLFDLRYRLEYLVVSHEPGHWNFSENTDLSEVLVVARKIGQQAAQEDRAEQVVCVNLWRNPNSVFEALAVAHVLAQGTPPDIESGQGALELNVGQVKFGEAVTVPWQRLRADLWIAPCAFAQAELIRAARTLISDAAVYLRGTTPSGTVPLTPLRNLGVLGPDRRDIWDGFQQTESGTPYPAFWGHDASTVMTIAQRPNSYLSPLPTARTSRPLRRATVLWPRAGRMLIAERLRLNTQRLTASRLDQRVLSNVWWPFSLVSDSDDAEKALSLWLNSTLGLLILLSHREETEGAWVDFKKPTLQEMPVLDVTALAPERLQEMADSYDRLCERPLLPFPQMNVDAVRVEIDTVIASSLGLPDVGGLRQLLAREPVVCLEPLS